MTSVTHPVPFSRESVRARVKAIRSRPKIAALSGCFSHNLMGFFTDFCDVQFISRLTVPMIAGNVYNFCNYYRTENELIGRRLNYELTHQFRAVIENDNDAIVIDPTSDFISNYFELNGCIINDLTSGLFGSNWEWPKDFNIHDWRLIKPTDAGYLDIYLKSLDKIIRNGYFGRARIIVLKRKIADVEITKDGLKDYCRSEYQLQADSINHLHVGLSTFKEIDVINLDDISPFTDEFAPCGMHPFHPSSEYMLLFLNRFCDHFDLGPVIKNSIIRNMIFHLKQPRFSERNGFAEQVNALSAERDTLIGRLTLSASSVTVSPGRSMLSVPSVMLSPARSRPSAPSVTFSPAR